MGRRYGLPTRIQQPIVGQPSVYLVTLNNQDLCSAVVLGSGLSGSCYDALRQGDGSIEANVEIVGGRLFVSGLAANNVTGVSVSEAVTDRTPASTSVATLMHNVYVAAIPYSGGGSGEITVKVERSDAPSVTVSVPAVPAPPGSRSGHCELPQWCASLLCRRQLLQSNVIADAARLAATALLPSVRGPTQ
ncbi:MAG TPA: hypothetical protein VFJ93_00805 [Gaiellaceae bacterium]|nr:hypothetical protein [Gaiellaceae bacterium]